MTATQAPAKPADGFYGLILEAFQRRIDPDRLRSVLGAPTVSTLDDVARAFGAAPNTVKQSWRSAGMPGAPGRWPLLEILQWRIEHVRPKGSNAETRQVEADARKTELQVEKLELEMAEISGRLIDRETAGTAFRSILSELAECATTIGDEMETEFPLEIAKEKVATINRKFSRLLTAAAEKGARVIPQPEL